MKFDITNEPVTGKARRLNIKNVNLNISYQLELVDQDNNNEPIMLGEVMQFYSQGSPMNTGVETEEVKAAKKILQDKIEQAFAEYFTTTEA